MKFTAPMLFLLSLSWPTSASILTSKPLSDLQLVGQAKLNVLFWEIYESSLYTADGRYQPEQFPVALRIQYLRDIDSADLLKATREEWLKQALPEEQFTAWLETLSAIWPDIQKGDELLLRVDAAQKSYFYYNNQYLGTLDDPQFGPAFLNIWLSEKASYPKLRAQLIGKEDE